MVLKMKRTAIIQWETISHRLMQMEGVTKTNSRKATKTTRMLKALQLKISINLKEADQLTSQKRL